jgi:hypothetical protein
VTLAQEIRQIVEAAQQAGKPISYQIIWGLLSTDVPETTLSPELTRYCRNGWLTSQRGEQGLLVYLPGPTAIPETNKGRERGFGMMGYMQLRRLEDARKAAKAWLKAPAGVAA